MDPKGSVKMRFTCNVHFSFSFRAFLDKTVSRDKKISLLREACNVHAKLYKDAMNGLGIDRHLFALYVISKGLDYVSQIFNFFVFQFLQQIILLFEWKFLLHIFCDILQPVWL